MSSRVESSVEPLVPSAETVDSWSSGDSCCLGRSASSHDEKECGWGAGGWRSVVSRVVGGVRGSK